MVTRAEIVLPAWKDSDVGKSWQPYLNKYKLVHTYQAGSYIFHTIADKLTEDPMGPTTWDVNVYIADSSVEEREAQILNSSIITVQLKYVLSSNIGKLSIRIHSSHISPHSILTKFLSHL